MSTLASFFPASSTPRVTILSLYESYLAHYRGGVGVMVSEATIRYLTQRYDTIRQFVHEQHLSQCSPADFATHADALRRWLQGPQGYADRTVNKFLGELTRVLKWGQLRELTPATLALPVKRLPVAPTELACLTEQELSWLESSELPSAHLRRVRDYFLLQCWTGLSYADLRALTATSVENTQGQWGIWAERGKTTRCPGTLCRIPVLPATKHLVVRHPFPLSLPTNQVYNRSLKRLADLCGITRLELTAQVGRNTGGVQLLNAGVAVDQVSRCIGHGRVRRTQQLYQGLVEPSILRPTSTPVAQAVPLVEPAVVTRQLSRLRITFRFVRHGFRAKQQARLCEQLQVDDPTQLGMLRVSVAVQGRDTVRFNVGLQTAKPYWDQDKQRATGPGSKQLNEQVAAVIHTLYALYMDLAARKQSLTAGALYRAFKAQQAGEVPIGVPHAPTHIPSTSGPSYSHLVRAVQRA